MAMTDTQELVLAIFIVIAMKVIFVMCLCKIRKCSESESSMLLTPRAMCRYMCCKTRGQAGEEASTQPPATSSQTKPEDPPTYLAPPKYEDALKSRPCSMVVGWSEPPPPYTISIITTPVNQSESCVMSDVTDDVIVPQVMTC